MSAPGSQRGDDRPAPPAPLVQVTNVRVVCDGCGSPADTTPARFGGLNANWATRPISNHTAFT
jgi:hypothetical protein